MISWGKKEPVGAAPMTRFHGDKGIGPLYFKKELLSPQKQFVKR